MCGILAMVGDGSPISDEQRRFGHRMNAAMANRGPDGEGLLVDDNVLLGHRRLAIRDFEGGAQPMRTPDGRFAITYNGEIYNDDDLRDQLTGGYGVTFQTRCDTETLLHAFRCWGSECVDRLQGMFAFVAVDFLAGEILMARDVCGVKPLYFTVVDRTLMAASSIAALVEHPGVPRRPNFRVISHYLSSFRLTLGSETMYDGIYQLMPGQRMRIKIQNGTITRSTIERYWQLPEQVDTIRFEDAVERLQTGLDRSVRRRQISDRPVGMLLSGGVDSAAIAATMSDQRGSFFALAAGEESQDAAATARSVGCELESIQPSQTEFASAWNELIKTTRLPASTPSDPVILLLAQTLKQQVDVTLGGEGADELLCGYAAQHWASEDYVRQSSRLEASYGRRQFDSPIDLFLAGSTLLRRELKPAILSHDAWRLADQDAAVRPAYEEAVGNRETDSPRRVLYRLIHHVNLEGQLARLDTATMHVSLEARVPYTDRDLCETMAQVPWDQHIRLRVGADDDQTAPELAANDQLETKRVLRVVSQRHLPKQIAQRRKRSFPTPALEWLAGPWSAQVSHELASSPFARMLIAPETFKQIVAAPEQAGAMLWPLMNLSRWGDREFAA